MASTTAAPSNSAYGSYGMQVDNTKAAAIPTLVLVMLIIAIFFTRHSLSSAYETAKGDFRKLILFGGGVACTLCSVFLLPTAAWMYALGSVVFSYMSILLCTAGLLEIKADFFFLVYSLWFLVLIGLPDQFSDGVLVSIQACDGWFPHKPDMCKESWLTWVTLLGFAIIIINFFGVIALMSLVFQAQDQPYEPIPDGNRQTMHVAPSASVGGDTSASGGGYNHQYQSE